MSSLRAWGVRFTGLFGKERKDRELAEELESHLQMHIEDNLRAGMSAGEARRNALIKLGGVEQTKEKYRECRGLPFIESFLQDVRFGLRMLRKSPGFTIVAVLTLALGIGANTAFFSVVQGVLLAPLPYPDANRLVVVWDNNRALKHLTLVSYPDFLDWQRSAQAFQQMAGFGWQGRDLTFPGAPERVDGMEISSGFFGTLGVKLALGREFSPEEDKHGGAPVVIISDRLWRDRFDGSDEALGKSVTLGGAGFTIVGVLRSDFHFADKAADSYTPLGQGDPLIFGDRTIHPIFCIGRLKPGVTLAQSDSDVARVQDHLDRTYPDQDRGLATAVLPLKRLIVGDVGGTLLLLLGAVGLALLIACANVASLLLARSVARSHEFAIRAVLGAKRARIVRQLVTESVLLSLAGGGIGLATAKWGVRPLLAMVPSSLPRVDNIRVNISVLLFSFGVSILVGILSGLSPALRSSKTDLQTALKEGSRGATATHHRAQSALVIVQMALALVLLVGAGLLFRTIRRLWEVNPGFDAQNVLTFRVGLSPSATKTGPSSRAAYQQLIERLCQIPGVQAADVTVMVPLGQGSNTGPFLIGWQKPTYITEAPRALYYWTGPDYLETMEIPLLRGRFFTPEDTTKSEPVIVIDSVLANAYFPNRDAVGQAMTIPHWGPVRVIGVVGHVQHWGLGARDQGTENQIYASFYQLPDNWAALPFYRELTVTVRTRLDTATVMPAIKAAVYGADSDQTVYAVQTMQEIVAGSMSPQRFPMILLGGFALLALLLASSGIYGVISYSVTERLHEIGVCMALGAEKHDILRMVIGQGLRLALAGVAIGGVAALILTRLLSSFSGLLYGVGTSDPATFMSVAALLTVVALAACYIPARRATRVDPIIALRHE